MEVSQLTLTVRYMSAVLSHQVIGLSRHLIRSCLSHTLLSFIFHISSSILPSRTRLRLIHPHPPLFTPSALSLICSPHLETRVRSAADYLCLCLHHLTHRPGCACYSRSLSSRGHPAAVVPSRPLPFFGCLCRRMSGSITK